MLLRKAVEDDEARQRFRDYLAQQRGDRKRAERSFNFVEVPYLFGPGGRDLSDEHDRLLAEFIAEAWRGWLMRCYPSRRFIVEVLDPDDTGSVVGISFYEDEQ